MKKKDIELICRGVDSELNEEERRQFDRMMAENSGACELIQSMETMGDYIRDDDAGRTAVPDVNIAWQDIRREIRQWNHAREGRSRMVGRLRWAGAMAAVLVVGLLVVSSVRLLNGTAPMYVFEKISPPESRVDWVETGIPGATTVIYTDVETDMTVIWMDVAPNDELRDT